MDAKHFVEALDPALKRRLKNFKVRILRDNLPTSVLFLVTSPEFHDVPRGDRIYFMADVVEETFGLPLEIGASGLALTPDEANELKPWENDESSDWDPAGRSEDPAAAPLFRG